MCLKWRDGDNSRTYWVEERRQPLEWVPPRCAPSICRTMCPYKDLPWHVFVMPLDAEAYGGLKAYVVFGKERKDNCICGCTIGYVRKVPLEEDVVGHESEFMRRHNMYLMTECPLEMEHKVYGFCKRKQE